jgi:hypothetical protein
VQYLSKSLQLLERFNLQENLSKFIPLSKIGSLAVILALKAILFKAIKKKYVFSRTIKLSVCLIRLCLPYKICCMKSFLSISLFIIMIASVVVPVVVQWQSTDVCELKESKSDENSDNELKVGKEKEVYISNGYFSILFADVLLVKTKERQYHKHDCLISENHALQLDMPPEA